MIKNIERYVDRCNLCQRMKNRIEVLVEKLITNKVLEKLWTYVIVDFITKLLLVVKKDAVRAKNSKLYLFIIYFLFILLIET